MVLDCEHRDLESVVQRHKLDEVKPDAVTLMLEPAVARAVMGDVGGILAADRQRRGTPQLAAVVIPNVDRLAGRIAHWIVGPWRELVLAAVPVPGVARPGLGDHESE